MASKEDRTVSSLVDKAVRNYIEHSPQKISKDNKMFTGNFSVDSLFNSGPLYIRHANLPDTSILYAYSKLAPQACYETLMNNGLPEIKFFDEGTQWNKLPSDLFSGAADILESVNWLSIFWHMRRGGSSPQLGWLGPYLNVFAGHCIFVHREVLEQVFSESALADYDTFKSSSTDAKTLSLNSFFAWINNSNDLKHNRIQALVSVWKTLEVSCNIGTDYQLAAIRFGHLLSQICSELNEHKTFAKNSLLDPIICGNKSSDEGLSRFLSGDATGFIGGLMQSSILFADHLDDVVLLAGPADLKLQSINTLAAKNVDKTSTNQYISLWSDAVKWYKKEVIWSDELTHLKALIEKTSPSFFDSFSPISANKEKLPLRLEILRGMLRTWVRWFESPEDARGFYGGLNNKSSFKLKISAEDLVENYEVMSRYLTSINPSQYPDIDESSVDLFWRFPKLQTLSKCD